MRGRNISKSEVQSPMSTEPKVQGPKSKAVDLTLDFGPWTLDFALIDLAVRRELFRDLALVADDDERHLVAQEVGLRDALHVLGRDGEDLLHVGGQESIG